MQLREDNCYLFQVWFLYFLTMPRPKLPEDQVMETVGVKLPPGVIAELDQLSDEWECKRGSAGRDLLLLGLAVVRATRSSDLPLGLALTRLGTDSAASLKDLPPTGKVKRFAKADG